MKKNVKKPVKKAVKATKKPVVKTVKKVEKPVEVKVEVKPKVVAKPKPEVKELPTFQGHKVIEVLIENDRVQRGHHLCKMNNGTTTHVPVHLFE